MAQRNKAKSVSMSRILSQFLSWAELAPEGAGDFAVHSMIRLTRNRLGMTQKQLAKRCQMPQSHIAKIESGKVDIQIQTLKRISRALFCNVVIGFQPKQDFSSLINERAKRLAEKRVKRVAGTMEMEKQLPDDEILERLIQAEVERILNKNDSAIWENE